MVPTLLGVVLLVFVLFNWVGGDPAYVLAGKISQSRSRSTTSAASSASTSRTTCSSGSSSSRSLTADFGASLEHQRKGLAHPRHAPRPVADGARAAAHHRARCSRSALALAVAYVRGSLTDRMVMIVCTVGLSISHPRLHHRASSTCFAYKLGWFPVQGWGDSFWENLFALRVAADPDRRSSSASRPTCGSTARSSSTRSTRTTCARRAPRASARTAIMWVHVLRNAVDPDHHPRDGALPGLLLGAFLIERFFSIPGIGREVILAVERSRLPGDQGAHRLRRVRDDGRQPAGRPHVQGASIRGCSSNERDDDDARSKRRADRARDSAHGFAGTVDARVAALATRPVGMVSLAIVVAFVAADDRFGAGLDRRGLGARRSASTTRRRRSSAPTSTAGAPARRDAAGAARRRRIQVDVVDPLADVIAEIEAASRRCARRADAGKSSIRSPT